MSCGASQVLQISNNTPAPFTREQKKTSCIMQSWIVGGVNFFNPITQKWRGKLSGTASHACASIILQLKWNYSRSVCFWSDCSGIITLRVCFLQRHKGSLFSERRESGCESKVLLDVLQVRFCGISDTLALRGIRLCTYSRAHFIKRRNFNALSKDFFTGLFENKII